MDVIIDQQEKFSFTDEPADILQAIGQVSDYLRTKRRAVLSIRLDGSPITPQNLRQTLEGKPLDSVSLLAVASEDIAKLVAECLDELDRAVPELPNVCHSLAEIFQGECPEAGYEPFQRLAEIWQAIKERERQIISALDLNENAFEVAGMTMSDIHEELNRYIGEAADALRAGDCVLLGDLLEYELAPRAERERDIAAQLRCKAHA